jgi:hypothetical protein
MKHAGMGALDQLDELLSALRERPALKERSRGVFYRGGKAWLHFHDDPTGLYADLRDPSGWLRLRVSSMPERQAFLSAVDRSLGAPGI